MGEVLRVSDEGVEVLSLRSFWIGKLVWQRRATDVASIVVHWMWLVHLL
jgi:hypothetical protein